MTDSLTLTAEGMISVKTVMHISHPHLTLIYSQDLVRAQNAVFWCEEDLCHTSTDFSEIRAPPGGTHSHLIKELSRRNKHTCLLLPWQTDGTLGKLALHLVPVVTRGVGLREGEGVRGVACQSSVKQCNKHKTVSLSVCWEPYNVSNENKIPIKSGSTMSPALQSQMISTLRCMCSLPLHMFMYIFSLCVCETAGFLVCAYI